MTFQVSLSVAKFDRFEDLEDQVIDYLASVTDLKVFGCSIDFLQTATQTYLEEPIWDKLQQGVAHTIVFRNCSVMLPSQEQLEGCPIHHIALAVHVPMNPEKNRPRRGLCRGSTSEARQCRVRHQAHWSRGLAKLPTAPHSQTAGHCDRHFR